MKKTDSPPPPLATRIASEDVLELLGQESDRGCILVAAAWIDELLGDLIRARLIDHKQTIDNLFSGANAPIGTLSARINFAHAMGVIEEDEWKAMHSIRALRNAAAHFETAKKKRGFYINFKADSVRNEIDNIAIVDAPLRAEFYRMFTPEEAAREIFLLGVAYLMGSLALRIESAERITPADRSSSEAWRTANETTRNAFAKAKQD
jgi:DNA-binding MltR family transcriptional regulator